MWKFWRRSPVMPVSERVRHLLAQERGVREQDAVPLRMLEERGHYAGRAVRFFKVFDPATVAAEGAGLRRLADLQVRSVLYSGHTERDGQIVLNRATSESRS